MSNAFYVVDLKHRNAMDIFTFVIANRSNKNNITRTLYAKYVNTFQLSYCT